MLVSFLAVVKIAEGCRHAFKRSTHCVATVFVSKTRLHGDFIDVYVHKSEAATVKLLHCICIQEHGSCTAYHLLSSVRHI